MLATLTKRILFCWHAVISISLAASTLLMTLTFAPASVASTGGMSCCPNGQSNHCSSGIVAKAAAKPEAEPACHHESVTETDPDTIVAEPSRHHAEPSSPGDSSGQAAPASIRAPCASDCCLLGPSTFTRPTRQSIDLIKRTITSKPLNVLRDRNTSLVVRYPRSFTKPIPRGPPSRPAI
jgi:hypothetical protein